MDHAGRGAPTRRKQRLRAGPRRLTAADDLRNRVGQCSRMSPDGTTPAASLDPIQMIANPLVVHDYELGCAKRFFSKAAGENVFAVEHRPERLRVAPCRLLRVLDVHLQLGSFGPDFETDPLSIVPGRILFPASKRKGKVCLY